MSAATERYRRLDDALIVRTLARLRDRITERFPDSGLAHVCGELVAIGDETAARVEYLRRPHWPVRVAALLASAVMLAVVFSFAANVRLPAGVSGLAEFFQGAEAAINDVIFLGVAVFFLFTLENRVKRRRALAALHELRSVVHIVDMHQLTKDPERLLSPQPDTASSPERVMSAPELGRYLDYCSELLSLASKIAALHVQHFNDPVVLAAVAEIETLASGLSGKIWQKITLLDRATAQVR